MRGAKQLAGIVDSGSHGLRQAGDIDLRQLREDLIYLVWKRLGQTGHRWDLGILPIVDQARRRVRLDVELDVANPGDEAFGCELRAKSEADEALVLLPVAEIFPRDSLRAQSVLIDLEQHRDEYVPRV